MNALLNAVSLQSFEIALSLVSEQWVALNLTQCILHQCMCMYFAKGTDLSLNNYKVWVKICGFDSFSRMHVCPLFYLAMET